MKNAFLRITSVINVNKAINNDNASKVYLVDLGDQADFATIAIISDFIWANKYLKVAKMKKIYRFYFS